MDIKHMSPFLYQVFFMHKETPDQTYEPSFYMGVSENGGFPTTTTFGFPTKNDQHLGCGDWRVHTTI